MVFVYPYDKVRYTAKGSYKYLYKVTSDVDETTYSDAGIDIPEPIDQVVVTLTSTMYKGTDIRERLINELAHRNHLVSRGLSLPIFGGWYLQSRYPSTPKYTNLNEIMNGNYNFMKHANGGDILIVYSSWCPSIAYNIIANPKILTSDLNSGFDFFKDTVDSQIMFIDKCVNDRVVYYDNKPENQCRKNNGDVIIIDTDPDFFESDTRILNNYEFLNIYAKVVMLIIYLLVFMVNLDIFDKKYQKNPSDIQYYQQFIKYMKQGGIPIITSTLISNTIQFLYNNKIDEALRLIKHYLSQYVPKDKYKELNTENGLIKWLLHAFHLQAPSSTQAPSSGQVPLASSRQVPLASSRQVPLASSTQVPLASSRQTLMPVSLSIKLSSPPHPYIKLPSPPHLYIESPSPQPQPPNQPLSPLTSQPLYLPQSSSINIDHALSNLKNHTRRTMDSITLRKSNKQKDQNQRRKIENPIENNPNNIEAKSNTYWLYDVWGQWYIPDNTPKEPLSSVWRIVNRGGESRRRPRKMNSRKKHLNKRTHKTINARTSKSNSK